MAQRICTVDPRSPAAKAGLKAGDEILRIGGEPVVDLLDYQALTAHRQVKMRIRRDGQEMEIRLRKGEYDDPGLGFEKPMMSGMRMCCNRCLFCFVDQLPANVRPSMLLKDDDWRMSLMMGSYVTLTNVSDRELERIIARHASPLYISVHAGDPALRAQILGQPRGARLLEQLKKLSDGGIRFHTQAVLCPGLNDGPALEETIEILAGIEGTLSLALVPVGLTGHRDGLHPLSPYTPAEAKAVIEIARKWQKKLLAERGTRFVFPSDEFYLQAGMPIPADEEYEDYGQIDDGVGLLRLLDTEFDIAWQELPESERKFTSGLDFICGCGESAAEFLADLFHRHPITGIRMRVVPVRNEFFGPSVTVSGLITGRDLTDRLMEEGGAEVFITECMLRSEGDRFLDDMTLEEAEARLGRRITPVGRSGEDLLNALLDARDRFGGK